MLCQRFYEVAFSALYSAQRFFVASIMRFRPAALSLPFLVAAFSRRRLMHFLRGGIPFALSLCHSRSCFGAKPSSLAGRRCRCGGSSRWGRLGFGGYDCRGLRRAPSPFLSTGTDTEQGADLGDMTLYRLFLRLQSLERSIQYIWTQRSGVCCHVIRL